MNVEQPGLYTDSPTAEQAQNAESESGSIYPVTLAFTLRCVPPKTSHHVKRIVRRGKFSSLADKPELVAAKESLDVLLLQYQPAAPVTGPVEVTLEFTWPWRSSETKRNRARGRMAHTVRPDLTNVAKTLEDRLVAMRFIEDDGQVVDLRLRKFWGDEPGIGITIRQYAPTPHSGLAAKESPRV